MKALFLMIVSILILTSCGPAPKIDYWKTKSYNVTLDLNDAIYHPLYLFMDTNKFDVQDAVFNDYSGIKLPYGYEPPQGKELDRIHRLMLDLDYYTPDNERKIFKRIHDYLDNAKRTLSEDDYRNIVLSTYYEHCSIGNIAYGFEKNKDIKLTIYYDLETNSGLIILSQNIIISTKNSQYSLLSKKIKNDPSDNLYQDLKAFTDKYTKVFTYNGYQDALSHFSNNSENLLRTLMISQGLRQSFKSYLNNYIPPKYQQIVSQKAEAFFKAWGIDS